MKEKFNSINSELGLNNIYFVPYTFQEYKPSDIFDIVILHNSIKHFEEKACIQLKNNKITKEEYKNYFRKLYNLAAPISRLIICDCSNRNFFSLIGFKNPFAPTIEWEKHQSPKTWANLLEECGYIKEKIRWYSFNRL